MNQEQLKKYIEKVIDIAYQAGREILDIYNNDNIGIELKLDDSPLTIADKKANEIICKGLNDLTPDIPIISEENKEIPYDTRKYFELLWMVDPLDGTKEFIKRNGEFTVNIALIHNQKSIAGVVYAPVSNTMYYAIKGEGAFKIEDNEQVPITANKYKPSDHNLRIVCSRSHLNSATQEFINNFTKPQLIARGSSLKFLIIAEGDAEIYPRLAPTMEWDTAAADIILAESGGSITQTNSSTLLYNKENLLNPHFIATASEHKQ